MREVKFNIYDKTTDTYFNNEYYDFSIDFGSGMINVTNKGMYSDVAVLDFENEIECVLLQYTGLKDINGKELYEGDIIKTLCSELGIIKYLEQYGGFKATHPKYGVGVVTHLKNLEVEIVGNIYENFELVGD